MSNNTIELNKIAMAEYRTENCKLLISEATKLLAKDYVNIMKSLKWEEEEREDTRKTLELEARQIEEFFKSSILELSLDINPEYLIPKLRAEAGLEPGEKVCELIDYD